MNAMPGPPTDDYDHSVPLKAVSIFPPAEVAIFSQEKYTVRIELSRNGSRFEQDIVKKYFPRGRIYGQTLELNETTIESVAENPKEVSTQLAALEREARKAEDAANELERQREEAAAAEKARHEELTRLASSVRFD